MQESQTWRTLLGTLIKDPLRRQQIASELGVNTLTLTRWSENKSNPRPESLRRLLNIFAEQRTLLLPLIKQEFPQFSSDTLDEDASLEEISSSFYNQVLEMASFLPAEQMLWTTCNVIFQQALRELDPRHDNVALFITQCVPPSNNNKVRSLRQIMGAGIAPWGGKVEPHSSSFLGADTIPGQVVSLARPIIVQNYREPRETGYESRIGIVSSCTYPLMRAGSIMGTFGATSILSEYFTPPRQALVQQYANLISILFPFNAFHATQDIDLRVMPPALVQLPHIAMLPKRVAQAMTESMHSNTSLTYPQAEQLVWQQLEEESLQLSAVEQG